ncbi:MAG: InlB B-repeat-containing protein [Eubacteriales bacterium]|nr:InlB B-repeat-containing protein [Eubacteriales bacterium]
MKKFICCMLAVLLMFPVLSASALSGDVIPEPKDVAGLTVETVEANPGDTVSVSVTLSGQYLANALTMFLYYDADKISVTSQPFTMGQAWMNLLMSGVTVQSEAGVEGRLGFVMASAVSFNQTGELFKANFVVHDDVEPGTRIPLTLIVESFDYLDDEDQVFHVDYTANNGEIIIPGEEPTPIYSVVFKDWDGTIISEQYIESGSSASAPSEPIRDGYTFIGWDRDFADVQSDMVITAQYQINSYTITYNVNGEFYAEQTYEYGAAVTAPEYTVPEGHTFSGWNVPEIMPAENLVLNATLAVITYEVTFVDGVTGNIIAVITVEHGNDAVAPEAPEHEGYIFDSWNGEYTNVTTDLTITAEYLLIGDVNGDGIVNTVDAVLILRYSMGLINIEFDTRSIDINGDGIVDISDAVLILRIAMNG